METRDVLENQLALCSRLRHARADACAYRDEIATKKAEYISGRNILCRIIAGHASEVALRKIAERREIEARQKLSAWQIEHSKELDLAQILLIRERSR
jgi:hypothetical protein